MSSNRRLDSENRKGAPPRGARREGIRPSLLIFALSFVACAVWLVLAVSGRSAEADDPEAAAADAQREAADVRGASRSGTHAAAAPLRGSGSGGAYQRHDWGAETSLSRDMALGLPLPGFWTRGGERGAAEDPQLAAMRRSFAHEIRPDEDEPPLPFEPTGYRADLLSAEGEVPPAASSCGVRILPVRTSAFNCVVRVVCDGEILYPNPTQTAGYVPCELEDGRPVRAVDDGQTSRDGDPLVDLDLRSGVVTVEELDAAGNRRYRATLRIRS